MAANPGIVFGGCSFAPPREPDPEGLCPVAPVAASPLKALEKQEVATTTAAHPVNGAAADKDVAGGGGKSAAEDKVTLDLPEGRILRRKGGGKVEGLAKLALGTKAEALYWERLHAQLKPEDIIFHDPTGGTKAPETISLSDLEAVTVRGAAVTLHFKAVYGANVKNKTGSVGMCRCFGAGGVDATVTTAPSRPPLLFVVVVDAEANRWGTAIRSAVAARLGEILPAEWNVQSMLSGSTGSMRALEKEKLPQETYFIVQELLDHSFIWKGTKDRRGRELPVRLEVVEVTRVMNGFAWVEYRQARNRVAAELAVPRVPRPPRPPEPRPEAEGEDDGNAEVGDIQSDDEEIPLDPPVRTATLEEPAMSSVLGELEPAAAEYWLFHGTTTEGAKGISDSEFRIDLAGSHRGTLYGKGVYLAECSSKADEYGEEDEDGICRMLLCRAALGRILIHKQATPAKELDARVAAGFNSLCGDRWAAVGTFREFVLYTSDQVYPAYIISYRRTMQSALLRAISECDTEAAIHIIPFAAHLAESHPDQDVRYRVALLLSNNEEKVVPALVGSLSDGRRIVRRSAASALGQLAMHTSRHAKLPEARLTRKDENLPIPPIAAAVPKLAECLEDLDEHVRLHAARALSIIGIFAGEAALQLQSCVQVDESAAVRKAVLEAMGNLDEESVVPVIPTIATCLADEECEVRCAAAYALGQLGRAGATAAPVLVLALEDPITQVREAVAQTLGKLASSVACPKEALVARLEDDSELVRLAVADALGCFGYQATSASSLVAARLQKDDSEQVRQAAAMTLGRIANVGSAGEASLQTLVECYGDKSMVVRAAISRSLSHFGTFEKTVSVLMRKGVKDQELEVRVAAVESLTMLTVYGNLGVHYDSVERLFRDQLAKDKNKDINRLAATGLKKMSLRRSSCKA
eukprot:TRINITY_DN8361_c0_g1_i1.p1 TRINITY_DN8361_c0_g1~~TRINITY_DN8361_c0_g1_i1.p1  ORF type:complete len:923 (+),score=182.26 TRINITY_DN8361_c0_g1_i1:106-2874(+)